MNLLWTSNSAFSEAVDKATSELIPSGEEDLALNLDICDQIRSKQVSAKEAVTILKRRISHRNPNVQLLALKLTDVCVKNGGDHFLSEVSSRDFMDNIVSLVSTFNATSKDVRQKCLELIQSWGEAFRNRPDFGYIVSVYENMKNEGIQFPNASTRHSSVLFESSTAPEWTDSEICMRCRESFSITNRKHHCRNCGQTYCGACSSKNLKLPHFGITQDVRVCDTCYAKLTKPKSNTASQRASFSNPRLESAEDDDLKKAIELSLKESGSTTTNADGGYGFGYTPNKTKNLVINPPVERPSSEEDPELAAAIRASLEDMRKNVVPVKQSSYKAMVEYPETPSSTTAKLNFDISEKSPELPHVEEESDISSSQIELIEKFSNLVKKVQETGAPVLGNTQLTGLHEEVSSLLVTLTRSLHITAEKHEKLLELYDKINRSIKLYEEAVEARLAYTFSRMKAQQSQQPQQPLGGYSYQPQPQVYNPPPAQVSGPYPTPYPSSQAPPADSMPPQQYQTHHQPQQSTAPASSAPTYTTQYPSHQTAYAAQRPPPQAQYYVGGEQQGYNYGPPPTGYSGPPPSGYSGQPTAPEGHAYTGNYGPPGANYPPQQGNIPIPNQQPTISPQPAPKKEEEVAPLISL